MIHPVVQAMIETTRAGNSLLPSFLDFSSFGNYLNCPRSWFFHNVLGLSFGGEVQNMHMVFGKCWHSGLEAGYRALQEEPTRIDYPWELEAISQTAFGKKWLSKDADQDAAPPKTYDKAMKALEAYWPHHERILRQTEILDVEMPFCIPVATDLPALYGTVDLVARRRDRGLFVGEHKTTGSFAQRWTEGWSNSWQVEDYMTGTWLYHGTVPQVNISGALFQKTSGPDFRDLWINKPWITIKRFMEELRYRLEQLNTDLCLLAQEASTNSDVHTAFPRNPNACQGMGLCAYYDWCAHYVAPYKFKRAPVGTRWLPVEEGGLYPKIEKS